ncbi:MAG: hypothetical protein DRN15_07630 [Thermoprotei archaeon]|nr:MAG: hypothetical protein DRN15_07630 [Thermoprotei archaeon]
MADKKVMWMLRDNIIKYGDLPKDRREEVKEIIRNLRERDYGYGKIRRYLRENFNIEIPVATLHKLVRIKLKDKKWIKKVPISWEPKRCKELAYIIGVTLGDGSITTKDYRYCFRVENIEVSKRGECHYPFIECVAMALRKLGLEPQIYRYKRRGTWYWGVMVYSKKFTLFLKSIREDPEEAKKYIKGYEAEFLRGFYESEGCLYARSPTNYDIRIINASKEYISLASWALDRLGIQHTMHIYKRRKPLKDIIVIYIGRDAKKFLKIIRPVIKCRIVDNPPKAPQAL